MRPFSVVGNKGFRRLLHTLEPKYNIPSRTHFGGTVIPSLYEESKAKVEQILKKAESIAITTDSWTSRGTISYIPQHQFQVSMSFQLQETQLVPECFILFWSIKRYRMDCETLPWFHRTWDFI